MPSKCEDKWNSELGPSGGGAEDDGRMIIMDDGAGGLRGTHQKSGQSISGSCLPNGMSLRRPAIGPPEVIYEGHFVGNNVRGRYMRFNRTNQFDKLLVLDDDGDWTGTPVT